MNNPNMELGIGEVAEHIAAAFDVRREAMDAFSLHSHQQAAQAQQQGYFESEIVPIYDVNGQAYLQDDGVEAALDKKQLKALSPVFDPQFGTVTTKNSTFISDGAGLLFLASEDFVQQHDLQPLGKLVDLQWAGIDPKVSGLGPVHASAEILLRHQLDLENIDYWEINEVFAAQVLACIKAFRDKRFCVDQLGLTEALGAIDKEKVNVDGGAIALGHPLSASGIRQTMHMLQVLKRNKAKRGIVSMCVNSGQGGALLVESM
jgi:acetyl-CoA C-acetyltransferase